ncbi:MAG: hypothetical protein IJI47_04730, partial [Eubacterium sp.]|nr:hypothetical protein [Eubacterium sp.]
MKKMTKRMLSLVLSAVMVITMLPTFSLTAFASPSNISNHLVGRYLVDGVSNFLDNGYDLITSDSGVTWESAENTRLGAAAAVFSTSGNGLMISKSNVQAMLADASKDTGFTIAFKGSRGSNGADGGYNWARFLDFDNGASGRYGAGPTNSLEFASNATVRIKSSNTNLTDISVNGDTWGNHNWVISVKEGYFAVYCDGVVSGTPVSDSRINAAWFTDLLGGNGQLLIGSSPWPGDTLFNGQIRDFRIYDKAASDTEAAAISSDITAKVNETTPTPPATSDYWQILASTDFTTSVWSKNSTYNWRTSTAHRTAAGGVGMGWGIQFRDEEPTVTVDDGVKFWYNSGSDHNQGVMYMTSYNSNTTNNMFSAAANGGTAVTSFKIDLKFSLFGQTKANSGNALSERRGENVFFKLCENDTKYGFESRYSYNYVYYAQESYGRRHMKNNSDIYAVSGTRDGGNYVLSTDKSYIDADVDYHYILTVADGWLCSYIADSSGNVVISYDPIDISNYSLSPSDITGMFINGSEFNFLGYEDFENVRYKSIEIYKGVDTSSYDSTKDHYLLTYFTGNSAAGETLHYAVSEDGYDYEAVNLGNKVWNEADYNASKIAIWPKSSERGIATSLHVRDPYVLRAQDGSFYILATDLNTHPNGEGAAAVYSNTSKVLVWHVDKLTDIPDTEPWVIDGTPWKSVIAKNAAVKRMWAPQAIWDPTVGKYMFYFSAGTGSVGDADGTFVYYTYTSDFKSFTTPKRLFADDRSVVKDGASYNNTIDADITYHNGLWYMWYKNEDNDKLRYAIANKASGPYQGFFSFDDNTYAMEGPSVFQTGANSYAMLSDAYDNGLAYVFTASSPRGFKSSTTHSTNVVSDHNYRHGCVTPITEAEYNEIRNLKTSGIVYKWRGVNQQRYTWNGNHNLIDNGADTMTYTARESRGSLTANDGTLKLEALESSHYTDTYWYDAAGGGVTLTNSDIPAAISNTEYTVDFSFKRSVLDVKYDQFPYSDNTIFAIFEGSTNYVRLAADGTFYVKGDACSPKANVSSTDFVRYTVVHNDYSTSLLVDGKYVCGAINTDTIPNTATVALGWYATSNNYRITGEYGTLSISPSAIDTNDDQLLYDYIDDFEAAYIAKMTNNNGDVYRNMLPAYKAYVDYNEALDAYKYGNESSDAKLVAAAIELGSKTDAMTSVWSANTPLAASATTGYSGALYDAPLYYPSTSVNTGGLLDFKISGFGGSNGSDNRIYEPNAVLLYDGSTAMTYPVSFWLHPKKSGTWGYNLYCNYIYPNADTISLSQNWIGDWYSIDKQPSGQKDYSNIYGANKQTIGYASNHSNLNGNKDKELMVANKLTVNSNQLSFSNGLSTISSTQWIINIGNNDGQSDQSFTSTGSIYVVDYRGVETAVNNNKATLATVEQYKEGGLLDFITAMDELTVDASNSTQNYSTNTSTKAANVAKSYSDGKTHMATASVAATLNSNKDAYATDGNGYIALRAAIDKNTRPTAIDSGNGFYGASFSVRDIVKNNGYVTYNGHTVLLKNYAAFKTAYDAAVAKMAALGAGENTTSKTSNYVNPSGPNTTAGTPAKAAKDLEDAYNALDALYNITYSYKGGVLDASAEVKAGASVTTAPENQEPEYYDNETHVVYTWPNEVSDGHAVWTNEAYSEINNILACNHNTAQAHVAAVDDVNGYTDYACSVCGHVETEAGVGKYREWDEHETEWDDYSEYVEKADDTTGYTNTSRGVYASQISSIISGVTAGDETKSKSFIDGKNDALETAANTYLNPLAEYSTLSTALSGRSTERSSNNYSGATQLYTYDSWINFAAKYDAGNTLLNITYTAEQKAEQGKFTVGAGNVVNNGKGGTTPTKSSYQNAIETNISNITGATLTSVAVADKYTTFDNARDVVAAMDRDKYTATGLAYIDGVKDAQEHGTGGVYHKLSAAEATAYNSTTGQSLAENALVKNSTNPDANTATLLSAVTTLDADAGGTYIKRFWVTLTVEDDGVASSPTSATVKYGDAHTFAPSVASGKSITSWSITNYDYSVAIGDVDSNNPIGSSKATGYGNNSLTKTVTNNLAVTAIVDSDAAASNKSKIVINDCYNKVQDVFFIDGTDEPTIADLTSSTITIGGTEVTAKAIPFYTFSTWRKTIDATNHVYKYTPVYTAAESFNFSFYGAQVTTLNSVQFDKRVTVQFDTSKLAEGETFKAWAVKTSANK